MICSSPRIEFGINLQRIMMALRKIRSTDSLKDIIKSLIANHMGSCPLDQQRGLFLLLLHEYLQESSRILHVYKMLWLIFFLYHTAIILARIFPNIILRIYWDANTNPSIPTTILCGILSCKYIVLNAPLLY